MNLVALLVMIDSFRVALLFGQHCGDLAIRKGDLRLIGGLMSKLKRLLRVAERRLIITSTAVAAPQQRQAGVDIRAKVFLLKKVQRPLRVIQSLVGSQFLNIERAQVLHDFGFTPIRFGSFGKVQSAQVILFGFLVFAAQEKRVAQIFEAKSDQTIQPALLASKIW